MELRFPNRACVCVLERVSNGRTDEVPEFKRLVTASGEQVGACWVEVDRGNELFVTLASHDVFAGFNVPDLPSAVIRSSGNDLLSHVQR